MPDQNLCDGASESATKGFFDVDNIPPWDFWVGYFVEAIELDRPSYRGVREYLASWIPPSLVPLAQAGIDVNPEACILWLDDWDCPLRDEALRRRLL
jgi:hypothetical protein